MKKINLTILLVTILSAAYAQNRTTGYSVYDTPEPKNPVILDRNVWKNIPNGTKIITSETGLTKDENFKKAINFLLDNNFEIEKYDETLGTIKTAPKPLPRSGVFYLNIRVKNNELVLSGLFNANLSIEVYGVRSESEFLEIEKRGGRNSAFGQAFFQLYNTANQLGKITNL